MNLARCEVGALLAALAAVAGCRADGAAMGDIPNPVGSLEMELAQASFWAVADASEVDAAAIDVALANAAPASDQQPPASGGVLQRARCQLAARRAGAAGSAQLVLPTLQFEQGVVSSAFLLDYEGLLACRTGDRALGGGEQVITIAGTGGGGLRTLEVSAAATMTLAEGGAVVTISNNQPDQPASLLGVPTALAAGDRQLRVAINQRRQRRDPATGEVLEVVLRATDANALTVSQSLATVADAFLRESYGNATTVVQRTIISGQVDVVGEAADGQLQALQAFEHLAFDYRTDCACPTGGVLRQAATYASGRVARNMFTFTGCGRADVVSTVSTDGSPGLAAKGVALWSNCL